MASPITSRHSFIAASGGKKPESHAIDMPLPKAPRRACCVML
jgi:hypothetical protein